MFLRIGDVVLALALSGAIFAAGCASGGEKSGSESSARGGMMCPTCKTVWTFETVGEGTKVQRLAAKPEVICPDCDAMAVAYRKDGDKVLHNCEMCKVTPTVLKPGPPPTHPKGPRS